MKALQRETGRKPQSEDGLFWFLATTETLDRYDSVILSDGIDVTNFLANPVFLDSHDSFSGIDRVLGSVRKVRRIDGPPKGIEVGVEFADTERGREAKALVEAEHANAVSVSLRPSKVRSGSQITPEERAIWGMSDWGYVVEESELLEVSLVAVPGNALALRREAQIEGEAAPARAEVVDRTDEVISAIETLSEAHTNELRALIAALGRIESKLDAKASGSSEAGADRSLEARIAGLVRGKKNAG